MPINKNELSREVIAKAMQCETAEDLMALAKAENIKLTKEEAEAFLAEIDDFELDGDKLKQVAGSKDDEKAVRRNSGFCIVGGNPGNHGVRWNETESRGKTGC